jgi:outer membrane protein TolC
MLQEQVKIVRWSDKIADKRYQISKKLYLNGRLDITNLHIAMQEKDQAKRNYIETLREFWIAYYEIRKLTLYDFENMKAIVSGH